MRSLSYKLYRFTLAFLGALLLAGCVAGERCGPTEDSICRGDDCRCGEMCNSDTECRASEVCARYAIDPGYGVCVDQVWASGGGGSTGGEGDSCATGLLRVSYAGSTYCLPTCTADSQCSTCCVPLDGETLRVCSPDFGLCSGGGGTGGGGGSGTTCTDVSSCVSASTRSATCCTDGVTATIVNHCGFDVECVYRFEATGTEGETVVRAGDEEGGCLSGIWTCNAPYGSRIQLRCSRRGEPYSCRRF